MGLAGGLWPCMGWWKGNVFIEWSYRLWSLVEYDLFCLDTEERKINVVVFKMLIEASCFQLSWNNVGWDVEELPCVRPVKRETIYGFVFFWKLLEALMVASDGSFGGRRWLTGEKQKMTGLYFFFFLSKREKIRPLALWGRRLLSWGL